jgi:hypothetical protein
MRIRTTLPVTLVLAVILSITLLYLLPVPAEANCWYPHRTTQQFYGVLYREGPPTCQWPSGIGPFYPYLDLIGERVTECDGTVTTWGYVDICPENTQWISEQCDAVCE